MLIQKTMKKLAQRFGYLWYIIAVIPWAALVVAIRFIIGFETSIIYGCIIIALIIIQIFALFILARYAEEVLD